MSYPRNEAFAVQRHAQGAYLCFRVNKMKHLPKQIKIRVCVCFINPNRKFQNSYFKNYQELSLTSENILEISHRRIGSQIIYEMFASQEAPALQAWRLSRSARSSLLQNQPRTPDQLRPLGEDSLGSCRYGSCCLLLRLHVLGAGEG
jgi:hypothetical protein